MKCYNSLMVRKNVYKNFTKNAKDCKNTFKPIMFQGRALHYVSRCYFYKNIRNMVFIFKDFYLNILYNLCGTY